MKALILAAGYATRLYPLTLNKAKPLLPIGGKPIINYIVEGLEKIEEIDQIYVVTNAKFTESFKDWVKENSFSKPIKVINDGTLSDEDKLGAIGDMHFVVKNEKIDDEFLVLAGDNIYETPIADFVQYYWSKKAQNTCIGSYDVGSLEAAKRYGIVELDHENQVVRFDEKPEQPRGTHAAIGLYLFPQKKIHLIQDYVSDDQNQDAPGFYISWLSKREKVYAFPLKGKWYDIGDLGSYEKADAEFKR